MKIKLSWLLCIIPLVLIFLFACNSGQEMNDKDLLGKWQLDSIDINTSKQKNSNLNEIVFYEDGSYKQRLWSDDVGNDYTGRFFIKHNLKRKYKTIILMPDLIIDNHDTILLPSQTLDIFTLTSNQLVICFPTEWLKKNTGETYKYNKKNYYKKIE